MTAVIEILSGDLSGRAYDVDELPFTIGRKDDCAIVIPKKYFSRKHAEIVERDGRFFVHSLSEKNPVLLEEDEVSGEAPLRDGAEFEICGVKFRFRTSGARGKSKAERVAEKLSESGSEGPSTVKYKRGGFASKNGSKASVEDIEDGPLPGDDESATEDLGGAGKNGGFQSRGSRGSGDGPAPTFQSKGSQASGSGDGRNRPDEGPRERIVFGEESEQATAPKASKVSAKGSGSGDDKDERTDQIDVSKLRMEADPFAEKKVDSKKAEVSAEREKFLRILVVAGGIGILMSAAMVWWYQQPEPPRVRTLKLAPAVGIGETRRYEEPWSEADAPDYERVSPPDGSPTDLIQALDPGIARAEWAVPDTPAIAYFLVTGVSPGTTSFEFRTKKGNTTIYQIEVSGPSRHDVLKKERTDKLAALNGEELKRVIRDRLRAGDELKVLGQNAGVRQERYPRQVLQEYRRAEEALAAYQKVVEASGVPDPELETIRETVRGQVQDGEKLWREAYAVRKKSYDDLVKRAQWGEAAKELQTVLWVIGDQCDLDFQRYRLLLEKVYATRGYGLRGGQVFDGPGCIEERP